MLHDHSECFQRLQFSCLSTLTVVGVVSKILEKKGKYFTHFCLACASGVGLNHVVQTLACLQVGILLHVVVM